MHYLVVIACFFTISPTFASDIESVVLTNYAIKELDGLNSHHKKCSDENPPCSGLLSQYILDAKSDGGYFGTIKSNWNTCQREINRSHRFSTSTDLAKYLNEKSDTAIGPIHYDRITSCTSGNAEEDKSTTGTYFYLLNRMKMGANSSLEQIATIDSLLGDNEKNILEGLNCGSILLPQTTLRCEELKKCKSKVGALSQLASETAWAEKMISQAKQKISEITFRRGYRANDPRVKKINNIIRFYEMKYPWLQSETYNNHRKGKGQKLKDIQEAIKAQLINNRATLKDSYSQFRYGAACLGEMDREEAACSVDALKKLLEKAPTFSAVEFSNNNKEEVMKSIAANQFYEAASCVENSIRDKDATAETVDSLIRDTGLTLITAGLAPVALGTKVAIASRTANLQKYSARIALGASYGVWSAPDVKNAIEVCSNEKEKLAQVGKIDNKNQCPDLDSPVAKSLKSYDSCVESSLLAAAGLLAATPLVLAKPLSRMQKARELKRINSGDFTIEELQRIKSAENAIGRPLINDEERALVIKAHLEGTPKLTNGELKYSEADIKEKAKILNNNGNGFSIGRNGETRKLLEAKVVGHFKGTQSVGENKYSILDGIRTKNPKQKKWLENNRRKMQEEIEDVNPSTYTVGGKTYSKVTYLGSGKDTTAVYQVIDDDGGLHVLKIFFDNERINEYKQTMTALEKHKFPVSKITAVNKRGSTLMQTYRDGITLDDLRANYKKIGMSEKKYKEILKQAEKLQDDIDNVKTNASSSDPIHSVLYHDENILYSFEDEAIYIIDGE